MNEETPDLIDHDKKDEPQHMVIVLAYTSTDGEIEPEFMRMVQDMKDLYSLRDNSRAYALVEEAAQNVLNLVEKPSTNG